MNIWSMYEQQKGPVIAAKLRGPGPAKYKLPGTTGYRDHDVTKKKMPAFSLGKRFNTKVRIKIRRFVVSSENSHIWKLTFTFSWWAVVCKLSIAINHFVSYESEVCIISKNRKKGSPFDSYWCKQDTGGYIRQLLSIHCIHKQSKMTAVLPFFFCNMPFNKSLKKYPCYFVKCNFIVYRKQFSSSFFWMKLKNLNDSMLLKLHTNWNLKYC